MLPRFLAAAAALFCAGCLLDDPYYVDGPAAGGDRPEDDDSPGEPGSPDERPLPEPEPERSGPAPQPEPDSNEPDDILTEPVVAPPEAEPVHPEPTIDVLPPAPIGNELDVVNDADASVAPPEPEPASEPAPEPVAEPEPTPEPDADPPPCGPGVPNCCGNGVAEGEACDGEDVLGRDCSLERFSGGLIQCTPDCELDTSGCIEGPECKDNLGRDVGVVFEGTLANKGSSTSGYSCSPGGAGDDVTFAWTAPTTECYRLTVSSDAGDDTIVAVFTGCDFETELACADNAGFGDVATLEFEAVVNTTYALVVDAYFASDEGPVGVELTPCASNPEPEATPEPEPVATWNCLMSRRGTYDGCDCGCGAFDPDCADTDVDACDSCGVPGSCASSCDEIDPEQNWLCTGDDAFAR